MTVDEGDSLASKASLATDFPVGNAVGPACADSVGTPNGHAGTKPFAGAGDSVPFDWIGSGSSAALGRAGADVGIAGIVPLEERKRPTVAFYGPKSGSEGGIRQPQRWFHAGPYQMIGNSEPCKNIHAMPCYRPSKGHEPSLYLWGLTRHARGDLLYVATVFCTFTSSMYAAQSE